MTDLEKAEAVVAKLEAKRAQLIKSGTDLADERAALAYSAHANNDAKAKSRLEQVHSAIATHSSELASLDAALRAATERVAQARQQEHDRHGEPVNRGHHGIDSRRVPIRSHFDRQLSKWPPVNRMATALMLA
jgi:septal ring factor EnvC (AmiA/AmiB activator)